MAVNDSKARTGNDSWRRRVERLDQDLDSCEDLMVRFLALSVVGKTVRLANEVKGEWDVDGEHNWTQDEWLAYRDRVAFEIADVQILLYRIVCNLRIDIDAYCDDRIDGI